MKVFQKQKGCCLVDAEAVADEECMCFSLGFSLGSLKFGLSLTIVVGNKQIRSKLFYPILECMCFSLGSLKSKLSKTRSVQRILERVRDGTRDGCTYGIILDAGCDRRDMIGISEFLIPFSRSEFKIHYLCFIVVR